MGSDDVLSASHSADVRWRAPAWFIYVFGGLGAILWGYDTGGISGAILYIKQDFPVSPASQGLITASITLGGVAGAVVNALIVNALGRRRLILIAALVFIVGTGIAATSVNVAELIAGRAVLGIGIGLVSVNVPVYLSEIAPARIRGNVVSMFQLFLSTGILLSYLINLALSPLGAWQWMIGLGGVPAILMLIGVFFLPESPRWLVQRGARDRARAGLSARGEDADDVIGEIERNLAGSAGAWRSLPRPWARRPLVIAVLMVVMAQFIGINSIVYYAPTILTSIGFSNSVSLITTVGFGIVSAAFVLPALRLVETSGRRRPLMTGAAVMGITMLVIAVVSWTAGLTTGAGGMTAIACIVVFKIAFSMTWGPMSRVVEAEILPIAIRGSAMSVAEVCNFIALFAVTLIFPVLLAGGTGLAYLIFAVMAGVSVLIVAVLVPETKGRTLEDIEAAARTRRALVQR